MLKIKTKKALKLGEYLNVSLKDKELLISKNGEIIGNVDGENFKDLKGRNVRGVVMGVNGDEVEIKIIKFADLHRHSGYSLLDGGSKVESLAELTEYAGAITDHGNMFGFLKFYKAMKKLNKQPIIGFESYAETIDGRKESNHLVLLAKSEKGYKNLIKLTSKAYHNFYKKPHVNLEMLKEHKEGLIVLSGCLGGEIPQLIMNSNFDGAKIVAEKYREIFEEDFYLEIQRHNIGKEEDIVNEGLVKLSKETGIKLIATTDSHYAREEDREMHEILLALQTKKTLSDPTRMTFEGDGYHIHTPEEMAIKFRDLIEAVDNTLEVAEKCSGFELDLKSVYMPKFEVPEGFTDKTYFEHLVMEGFRERFPKGSVDEKVYVDRIKREINVINGMGYASYFLIVWDFIKYAKDNGIMVGPGRGSAAGSLVSYCLHITDLDPIPYDLLFERFLNPERVSLPDIDIDFCYERREEVIDYVKGKYGEEAVSGIVTFGTFAAKMAVRDVSRVMDMPYHLGDKISKAIPERPGITIKDALEESPELMEMYKNNNDARKIIDVAMGIEGLPRHSSTHACGVVISDGPVDNYIPEFLSEDRENKGVKVVTSQVTMTEVEDLGLVKMDFLGLKTMSIIGRAIKEINKGKNAEEKIEYLKIPYDDPYVYREISKGQSHGVFQLEGAGMRSFMTELYSDIDEKIEKIEKKYKLKGFYKLKGKKENKEEYLKEMKALGQELFERLIAGVSLYRPGPMDFIPNYIKGIKNPDKIVYLTPKLEPILETTYGVIVYQEQVMKIVQELAGYSLARADLVRRAMGKKKAEIMEEEKNYFINGKLNEDGTVDVPGCVRNGIPKGIAEDIWEQMADFSKYAFNKSHKLCGII